MRGSLCDEGQWGSVRRLPSQFEQQASNSTRLDGFAHSDREVLGLDVGTDVANVWVTVGEKIEEVRTKRMETLRNGRGIHDERLK